MIKKLKSFLIFLIILPAFLVFVGCKKNNNNNGNDKNQQQEQPIPGDGDTEDGGSSDDNQGGETPPGDSDGDSGNDSGSDDSNDDNTGDDNTGDDNTGDKDDGDDTPVTPPEIQKYSVNVDYNLPDKFEFLLDDYSESLEVGNEFTIPVISSDFYAYFDGWYDSTDKLITTTKISANANEIKTIKAKWTDDFSKYYKTAGLEFITETDSYGAKIAKVSAYTGLDSSVIIPKFYIDNQVQYTVSEINDNVFKDNQTIKYIATYADFIKVGNSAFLNSSLENMDFSNITYISDSAFSGTNITSAKLSKDLSYLGKAVFKDAKKLTKVDFSNVINTSIQEITDSMFYGCSSLTNFVPVSSMKTIASNAFNGCTSLASVEFLNNASFKTINSFAFANCSALTSVTIPTSITSFGYSVFDGCTNISTMKIARFFVYNQLKTTFVSNYGNIADSLKNIEIIGEYATILPSYYFVNCTNLESFNMKNSAIQTMESGVFSNCSKLKTINFSTKLSAEGFDLSAVESTLWYNEYNQLFVIGSTLVFAPKGVEGGVTIASNITKIAKDAFKNNSKITSITIPETITAIGSSAFYNCTALATVNFASNKNITIVDDYTFFGCANLQSINLENLLNCTTISDSAFASIGEIETLKLPAKLESISSNAFVNAGIKAFEIDSSNTKFTTQNGSLFGKDSEGNLTTLYMLCVQDDVYSYTLPNTITVVNENALKKTNIKYLYVSSTELSLPVNLFAKSNSAVIFEEHTTLTMSNYSNFSIYCVLDSSRYDVESSNSIHVNTLPNITLNGYVVSNCCVMFEYEDVSYIYLTNIQYTDVDVTLRNNIANLF